MTNKIEALVDAIGKLNGIHNPESEVYSLRNPLRIKSFSKPGKHQITSDGLRVFDFFLSGYKAGVFDITLKLEGKSRSGLKPDDALSNLLSVYGFKEKLPVDNIVTFLRRALKDPSISATTPLTYFLR